MTPKAFRGAAGRADLLVAYAAAGEEGLEAMARIVGYREEAHPPGLLPSLPSLEPDELPEAAAGGTEIETQELPFAPIPFWRLQKVEENEPEPRKPPELEERALGPEGLGRLEGSPPATPPILPSSRLWPALRARLVSRVPSRRLDVNALADRWSRGLGLERVPYLPMAAWAPHITVVVDRSDRLIPFWEDQDRLLGQLRRRLGRGAVREVFHRPGPLGPWRDRSGQYPRPPLRGEAASGTPVLALGDLGCLSEGRSAATWRGITETHLRAGGRLSALIPCPPGRWRQPLARRWGGIDWAAPNRAPTPGAPMGEEERRDRAERLLALLSFASRMEPGLLRTVRRLLPPGAADLETEADAWNHPEVVSGFSPYATLSAEARERLHARFVQEEDSLKAAVVAAQREWRRGLPREIWLDEVLSLSAAGELPEGALSTEEVEAAEDLVKKMAATAEAGEPVPRRLRRGVLAFARRSLHERPTAELWDNATLRPFLWKVWHASWPGDGPVQLPSGVGPEIVGGTESPVRSWEVWQVGGTLHSRLPAGPVKAGKPIEAGSLLARLSSANGLVSVEVEGSRYAPWQTIDPSRPIDPGTARSFVLRTDHTAVTCRSLQRPSWASAMGRDRFGLWASFRVGEVEQRMRWVPPGSFLMGSPEDEPGRWHDEGPQHLEVIAKGYWLADTPCTQALWEEVMGKNPSHFRSPDRPVESVSWEQCQQFLEVLGSQAQFLSPRLPSEVEWEYACRAGTTTATYAGAMEILGERHAPVLDDIAWYGGNSGVGFELESGVDSSDWRGKQYPDSPSGTHPVAGKLPNAWGLYDMLGNVHEWCEDRWRGSYEVEPEGTLRVVRGGSWILNARYVRAAYRYLSDPSFRDDFLGFRLARGQAALQQEAEPAGAERQAGEARGEA